MSKTKEETRHYYIALDTETTGTNFLHSQVISCGAIFLNKEREVVSKKEWLVNYDVTRFSDWNDEAAKIHGIKKEDALKHGVPIEDFIKEFEQEIFKHFGPTHPNQHVHFIGVNAYFDFIMLENMWKKIRTTEFIVSRRTLDLNSIGLFVLGINGLTTLLDHYKIQKDEKKRHSALYDAEMHLAVFNKLVTDANELGSIFHD